ncbi:5'/3'-nucleotidase SurE [Leptodesmis sichuanensis]|jgi:5'-nucleotidase|uniref:5'/3'-nucleotidase SurE n=1 Tax=Leptodesmis sichuanensis TaxID=2906798 RepID=UPI001F23DAAB|nr:5'/3'-nucleotidase SurE [Leptodesmis sichuanensis]UIE37386.1 5'/3'-nucleotidase SurE [Leptodesmis sichuanensis A121]
MVFVVTNDDGIDAPGIKALVEAVKALRQDVVVVAPQTHLSGCSHQVTTDRPIQIEQRSNWEYAIAGTPADCTRIALSYLGLEVDYVLSGINSGGNLGADVHVSGTVAAVREASLHRIPGVAISHYRQGKREIDWELATAHTIRVLATLLAQSTAPGTFWNVNLPHLSPGSCEPAIQFCSPCTQPLPAAYRVENDLLYYTGEYANRLRDPGADVEVCFSGHIAVTLLHI